MPLMLADRMVTVSNKATKFLPLTAPVPLKVAPIGHWYIQHQILNSQQNINLPQSIQPEVVVTNEDTLIENQSTKKLLLGASEPIDLEHLDPTAWKSQDHYKLLGLGQIRYKATMDDIKTAYKNKVIKHHPDKLNTKTVAVPTEAESKELSSEDQHFQCIVKAHEILSNPPKRRAYDSSDPLFDDSIPDSSEVKDVDFFELFGSVFERNSHFSNIQPVPQLGEIDTPYPEVQVFYRFWFEYSSWREFSYLDDEEYDPEKAENREEKRWLAKQNKQGRAQLKRNETQRIIELVELAFGADPRIQKAEDEERQKKEEDKRLKQERQAKEQEQRERKKREKEETELREKEEKADMERLQEILDKKQREERKQAFKKQRNEFKTVCSKHNNFSIAATDSASAEMTQNIIEIENLCQALSLEELSNLTERISKEDTSEICKCIFEEQVCAMREKQEEEMQKSLSGIAQGKKKDGKQAKHEDWSNEETQILVKAVTLYPAGTLARWDVIANYINKHSSSEAKKTSKHVINRVKNIQKMDGKETIKTDQAFSSFEKSHLSKIQSSSAEKTINYETAYATVNIPWTGAEQKLLEEGLRAFPTTDKERWQKIAEKVGTRDEKECKKRFKEIVESLQAKKSQPKT